MINYDTVIAAAKESIADEQAAFARTLPHMLKACDSVNRYLAERPDDQVYVSFSAIFDRAEIVIYMDNLADVTIILKMIRQAGYHPLKQKSSKFLYSYAIDPKTFSADISIYTQVSGKDGATCRQVQVGTKVVPVYEIQCAGDGQVKRAEEPEPTTTA